MAMKNQMSNNHHSIGTAMEFERQDKLSQLNFGPIASELMNSRIKLIQEHLIGKNILSNTQETAILDCINAQNSKQNEIKACERELAGARQAAKEFGSSWKKDIWIRDLTTKLDTLKDEQHQLITNHKGVLFNPEISTIYHSFIEKEEKKQAKEPKKLEEDNLSSIQLTSSKNSKDTFAPQASNPKLGM